tara:strand:+ start:1765 stop:2310 length:546 start_codon:yes stop_codon:yes gene_type:complete
MQSQSTSFVNHEPLNARAVANQFLDWADQEGVEISNMKLQKMLFFAHADFTVETGRPLLSEAFQAWDYGPVIPQVYRSFSTTGSRSIKARAKIFDPLTATSKIAVLEVDFAGLNYLKSAFQFYCKIGAFTLSDLSHAERGPWEKARELFDAGLNPDRKIKNEVIARYHQPARSWYGRSLDR